MSAALEFGESITCSLYCMGNLSTLDGTAANIVERVLPFTEKDDGMALAEAQTDTQIGLDLGKDR